MLPGKAGFYPVAPSGGAMRPGPADLIGAGEVTVNRIISVKATK
jgi:hypothetical protein